MNGYYCDNPGTFECLLLGIVYFLILGPLELLFGLFGYDFYWRIP